MFDPLPYLAAVVRAIRSEKRIRQVTLRLSPSVIAIYDEMAMRSGIDRGELMARDLEARAIGSLPNGMFRDSALDGYTFHASRRDAEETR